jgi:hypothetical protein
LLGRARFEYLNSIAEYNASQFELYVALGQPPANALARPGNPGEQAPDQGAMPAGPRAGETPPEAQPPLPPFVPGE